MEGKHLMGKVIFQPRDKAASGILDVDFFSDCGEGREQLSSSVTATDLKLFLTPSFN